MRAAPTRPDRRRRAPAARVRLAGGVVIAVAALAFGSAASRTPAPAPQAKRLPPIVFVSRQPATGSDRAQVPGVGPRGRTLAPGGRLLVREKDGRVREVLPAARFHDVSDPAVSWDGTTIAFAAVEHPADAWRLWTVRADGSGLTAVTKSDRRLDFAPLGGDAAGRFTRYDDFDPTWLPDGRIAFASTRFPQRAQQGDGPVSNLFVVGTDGGGLERLTSERNGLEEPSIDPNSGRVVYARWFFSPYLASDEGTTGLTLERAQAVPMDSVDLWQAISVLANGDRAQLAGGDPRERTTTQAYAPILLASDSTLVGVRSANPALLPDPGPSALVAYPGGFAPPLVLAGPGRFGAAERSRAMAPAALPDGRIAFAYDPVGDGDFGLWAVRPDGTRLERVLDLPGTHELDPAPLVARRAPIFALDEGGGIEDLAPPLPATTMAEVTRRDDTFRFDCLNVFATGPVDSPFPDAPRIGQDVRIRFYATLARPGSATGDSVVLVRESKIEPSGAVHEHDIPGDVPMFEQLVDGQGRVLRSPRGPAHVPGANFSRAGSGTKCIGCHSGHSALPAPRNNLEAKWFNASPSATVEVEASLPGSRSGAALVDRKARGPVLRTGWVAPLPAGGGRLPGARLEWPVSIEVRAVVLYAPQPDRKAGTDLEIRGATLTFWRGGVEVGRHVVVRTLRPEGTRIDFPPVRLDAITVVPTAARGRVEGQPAVALAEVETDARLIEDVP
ncbi:MAG: hypothetical protein ABIP29_00555 [Candidatus Eisenbacteria bacterium]